MEKIPYDTILDIQRKVDIVSVIGEYLPLEQRGKNYFAVCPFHDDHNPSMSISKEKQIYTCFVCGASGNVFNFVSNYEKVSFSKAVSIVASKIGIKIDSSYEEKDTISPNQKYYDIFNLANKYYQNNINTVYGKEAIKYLNNRKLDDDVIKNFEIGLSFDDNGLSKLLESKKYLKEDINLIGLCGIKGNFTYDIFRNRIMFPIHDSEGRTIGFSGRIYTNSGENKYVNSKESIVFKKGNTLYNYSRAIKYVREKKQVIIVEGFMDVIRLYTVGIKNVVATMGTAITKEHASLIRRLSSDVVLCFDGDKAGEKATVSAIEALEKIDIEPKVIRLEDDLDPDEYILKKGFDLFLTHLKNATSSFEFKINKNKKNINFNDATEVSNYINESVKELSKINDKIVYELTIKKLSKQTGVDVETIESLIDKKEEKKKIIITKPVYNNKKNRYIKAEEYLIYYMLRDIDTIKIYKNNVSYLSNRLLSRIACEIEDFYDKKNYIDVTDFTVFLQDKTDLINEVLKIDSLMLPNKVSNDQIYDYVKTIDNGVLKNEINHIKEKIEKEDSVAKKVELLKKLAELKKKESV